MAQTATMTQTVDATVNYFPINGETNVLAGTAGYQRRPMDPRKVKLTNIRGNEQDFTLERNGFQVVKENWTQVDPDEDPRQIEAKLFPEAARILQRLYVDHSISNQSIQLTNVQDRRNKSCTLLTTRS